MAREGGAGESAAWSADGGAAVDQAALAVACAFLGEKLGVTLVVPATPHRERSTRAVIGAIARASRLRIRAVALRGAWWERDLGPLLAVRTVGSRPVVLLPDLSRRYWLHDPQDDDRRPLTAALATTLEPFAYSVVRPMPAGPPTLARLLRFGLRDSRGDLVRLLALSVLLGALALLPPQAAQLIVDGFIPERASRQILLLALLLVVAVLAGAACELTRGFVLLRIETRLGASLQEALWDRLLRLPVSFFRDRAVGDLAQRASSLDAIRQVLATETIAALLAGAFACGNLIVLCRYDGGLARLALALTAGTLLILVFLARRALIAERHLVAAEARLGGMVLQLIAGVAKLRVAGAERRAHDRWAAAFAGQQELARRAGRIEMVRAVVTGTLPLVAALALFAALLRREEALSPGIVVASLAAYGALFGGLGAVGEGLLAIARTIPFVEQAAPLLAAAPEARVGQAEPGPLRGSVALEGVSFGYEGAGRLALNELSLEARPGEFVAIVGPSGSGKSTLLRLLLGFAEPKSGMVRYDDRDLATLAVEGVRRQIGVVLQDDQLIPGDILTNIAGAGLASLGDAWAAAELAGVAEEIRQLPMGMYTAVGAGASTFSGGQRQRLLIARAVVHRPAFLFFDEATSALDNLKQEEVMAQLAALPATRIVIAHRLSTIQKADHIYVLVAGRIAQVGRYDDLAAVPGPFRELIRRQQLT